MFDDIIKNKANEHEAPVPPGAWDNIVKKKKKRRFGFWWWGGLALLLLVLSTAGYLYVKDKADVTAAIEKDKKMPGEKDSVVKANSKESEDAKASPQKTEVQQLSSLEKQPLNEVVAGTTEGIADASVNKNQNNVVTGKALVTIATQPGNAGEDDAAVIGNNKKTKNVQSKVKAKQVNATIGEDLAAEGKIKIDNSSDIGEEKVNEPIGDKGDKQPNVAVAPVEKELPAVNEEKKTAVTDNTKTGNKKEDTSPKKQTSKRHWYIDATATPLLTTSAYDENISFNRTVAANNSVSVYNAGLVKTSIEPAVAFSLSVRRELNKKISVGAGLQYLLLKENISIEGKETHTTYTPVERLENGQLVADTVTTVTEGNRTIKAVNSYQLLSIPLFIQYSIIQKKQWSLAATGGMYLNIGSSYQNEIDRNTTAPLLTTPVENKSNTGVDVFTAIRIAKTLGSRFEFFAMPSMRWNLTKYNIKNSLLNKSINQAGVGFGLSYKIN